MIGLVDGNNFFVSCERVFNRRLVGRPVADTTIRAVGGVTLLRTAMELRGIPCCEKRDYEAAPDSVEGVVPSPENLAWAEEMRARGRENHAIATRERWEKRRAKRR